MRFAPRWADLKVGPYVLSVAVLSAAASSAFAQSTATDQTQQPTTTQAPPPSGTLEPGSTSPLQGATPATPTAPGAPVPPPPLVTPVTPGTNSVAPPPLGRVFATENGLIFNAIKPDKVLDFETVINRLRMALATSKDPVRQQQARGWKIFKAVEPGPNNSVLYVFVMDPAVKGADYGVAKILSEAYPTEITDLYRMYTGAFATAGQTIVNLQPVTDKPATPGTTTTPTAAAPGAPATTAPATAAPRTPPATAPPTATPPSR